MKPKPFSYAGDWIRSDGWLTIKEFIFRGRKGYQNRELVMNNEGDYHEWEDHLEGSDTKVSST